MALTVAKGAAAGKVPLAPLFAEILNITFDASYPTGGEVLGLAAQLPGKTLVGAWALGPASDGRLVFYDVANDKVKVFQYDYDAVADGGAIEIPDTTSLTGVTASLLVVSQ